MTLDTSASTSLISSVFSDSTPRSLSLRSTTKIWSV